MGRERRLISHVRPNSSIDDTLETARSRRARSTGFNECARIMEWNLQEKAPALACDTEDAGPLPTVRSTQDSIQELERPLDRLEARLLAHRVEHLVNLQVLQGWVMFRQRPIQAL